MRIGPIWALALVGLMACQEAQPTPVTVKVASADSGSAPDPIIGQTHTSSSHTHQSSDGSGNGTNADLGNQPSSGLGQSNHFPSADCYDSQSGCSQGPDSTFQGGQAPGSASNYPFNPSNNANYPGGNLGNSTYPTTPSLSPPAQVPNDPYNTPYGPYQQGSYLVGPGLNLASVSTPSAPTPMRVQMNVLTYTLPAGYNVAQNSTSGGVQIVGVGNGSSYVALYAKQATGMDIKQIYVGGTTVSQSMTSETYGGNLWQIALSTHVLNSGATSHTDYVCAFLLEKNGWSYYGYSSATSLSLAQSNVDAMLQNAR